MGEAEPPELRDGIASGRGEGAPRVRRTFQEVHSDLVATERTEGWLVRCEEEGCFVALNDRFVDSLAEVLRGLGDAPVLEVCAGSGALAASLRAAGVEVIATDIAPPRGAERAVVTLDAREALRHYRPTVVLGSFVPLDSGVDRRVLSDPQVRHYVVLNARLCGELGAAVLWSWPGWKRTPLAEVTSWMISRHDVWIGPESPLLRRGEAWLFSRV